MGYGPHYTNVCASSGFYVGAIGNETQVIDSDGVWVGTGITLETGDDPLLIGTQANTAGSGLAISSSPPV